MQFQLDITLTEDDYLAFNHFHSFESASGKIQTHKTRTLFITIMAVLSVLVILTMGWTTFSVVCVIFLGLFTLLYMLIFKKFIKRIIKAQIKKLKKTGKLPFDPVSKLEFHEDKLVEINAAKRVELSYAVIERICVAKDRYVFLYTSSVVAYILPIAQINKQLNQEDFLNYLSQKCHTVEYY